MVCKPDHHHKQHLEQVAQLFLERGGEWNHIHCHPEADSLNDSSIGIASAVLKRGDKNNLTSLQENRRVVWMKSGKLVSFLYSTSQKFIRNMSSYKDGNMVFISSAWAYLKPILNNPRTTLNILKTGKIFYIQLKYIHRLSPVRSVVSHGNENIVA